MHYEGGVVPKTCHISRLGVGLITGRNEVVAKVIFLHLSVIHSVHRGGFCLSACWDTPPPPGADPPRADIPPEQTTPGKQTPAYGLRAAGTHPTGMHSCLKSNLCFDL